jgi:hypothetical protein
MFHAIIRGARAFYLITLVAIAVALLIPSLGWVEKLERVWGPGRVIQVAAALALLGLVSEHVLGGVTRLRQGALARAIQRFQPVLRHKEAIEILIRALESTDTKVSGTAHRELKRLTRQDLPADPAAWRMWLAQEERAATG